MKKIRTQDDKNIITPNTRGNEEQNKGGNAEQKKRRRITRERDNKGSKELRKIRKQEEGRNKIK